MTGRASSAFVVALALAAAAVSPAFAARAARPPLANRCVVLGASDRVVVASGNGYRLGGKRRSRALHFFLKPTGLGTYMLYDAGARLMTVSGGSRAARGTAPAAAAEWA